MPYRKIHKVIRFRLSEIERWIDGGGNLPLMKDEADGTDGAALEAVSGGETGAALVPVSDGETGGAVGGGGAE